MRRGETTTWAQTAAMVDWLEAEGGRNFKFITGQLASEAPGVVAGRKLTKHAAYGDLADYVNEKCGTNWNSTKAEPRYRTLETKFKSTKRKLLDDNGAKYMLSEADQKRGINTIEKKLESDCPFFSRLDVLYGERQNIMPTYQDQPHDIFEAPTQSFVSLLEKASSSQASDSTDSDLIPPANDGSSNSRDFSSPTVKSMKRKASPTLTDKIIEMMQQREQKNGKSQQAMIICELIKSLIKKLMII